MLFGHFALIIGIVITLVMLVPFGFLLMYAVIALKQLAIGKKEDNIYKKKGRTKSILALNIRYGAIVFCMGIYYVENVNNVRVYKT